MTKDEYKQLKIAANAPRCILCEHLIDGTCIKYKAKVPEAKLYNEIECEFYSADIPF